MGGEVEGGRAVEKEVDCMIVFMNEKEDRKELNDQICLQETLLCKIYSFMYLFLFVEATVLRCSSVVVVCHCSQSVVKYCTAGDVKCIVCCSSRLDRSIGLFFITFSAIMIERQPTKGTCRTSLSPGDVIISTSPVIYILSHEERGKMCDSCFRVRLDNGESLKRCTGCRVVYYCDHECQKRDWRSFHKHGECAAYKRVRPIETDILTSNPALFLMRMYLTCEAKPEIMSREYTMTDGTVRTFKNMKSHVDDLVDDDPRMKVFNSLLKKLQPVVPIINIEVLLHFYGKMVINAMPIIGEDMREVGSAMSVEASIFNHSCCPNGAFVWDGLKVQLRALKHIPVGEEITVNYIDLEKQRSVRRRQLKDRFYFDCNCSRCSFEGEEIHLWNQMKELNERIRGIESDVAMNEVTKSRDIYLTQLKLLPLYHKVYGDFHPIITHHLMLMMKRGLNFSHSEVDSFDFVCNNLRASLAVTHGKDHSLFLEFEQHIQQ